MNGIRSLRFALLALLLAGCSAPDTPEQRIRELIGAAEEAVEKKEIGTLRGFVAQTYSDAAGRDRRAIDGLLRVYLLRHDKIHLLTRIESVTVTAPARAEAVIYVAMAARPIARVEELGPFRADLYRFEVRFVEEDGEWRVVGAAWRPAELADFVYQE